MAANDTNETPFIFSENLVKIYKVADLEVVALQGLDLQVPKGEILGIVGTSGSGKSTLLNILGGLDRPTAGKIFVDGLDLLNLSARDLAKYRRSKVGFVWQQASRNLIPYLTAQENVELPMTIAGRPLRLAKELAGELLDAVGLADRRHHQLAQLSGGQQQRVAIALALANEPPLLLADEPTGEVDSANARVIFDTFHTLNERYNVTTIIVSHDRNIAHEVDRVVSIRDGKISTETVRQAADDGTPDTAAAKTTSAVRPPRAKDSTFEELVVLDAAGRLQIPKDLLQQWGIGTRARIESVAEGILIKPTNGAGAPTGEAEELADLTLDVFIDDEPPPPTKTPAWQRALGGLFGGTRTRRK